MHDDERAHQPGDLAELEEVRRALRTPAELSLDLEEGFHHEEPARGNRLDDSGGPRPVEIVEHQHEIEEAQIRPGCFQIGLDPLNLESPAARLLAGFSEPISVLVHRHHGGAELGRGQRVPTGAARDV